MASVTGPLFKIGEYLVFAAFAFHAVNGIRLALIELGFAVGQPIEPVYPYATSVGRQRPLALAVLVIAGVIAVWGGYDFFVSWTRRPTMRDRTLWTWHIFAGVVILVFLGLHMTIMHLDGDRSRIFNPARGRARSTGRNVAARMRSLFFTVTYVVLLGAALFHGLYGLRQHPVRAEPRRRAADGSSTSVLLARRARRCSSSGPGPPSWPRRAPSPRMGG